MAKQTPATPAAEKSTVQLVHPAIKRMEEHWPLITALRGGTVAMRKAGETYMPKRELEEASDYKARLACATLYPAFTETTKTYKGRAFAEQPVATDDTEAWIKDEILPDIDMQGTPAHVYFAELFDVATAYGLAHTLTDAPAAVTPDGAPVVTRADEKKAGLRPYCVLIEPTRIVGWRVATNGKLSQVRIRFCETVPDGEFGQVEVDQIRVYEIAQPAAAGTKQMGTAGKMHVRVFEKKDASPACDDWVERPDLFRLTELDEIPLDTYYTERTGFMEANPPLKELAYLNAKHWSMQCSNDALIETASVPILAAIGFESEDALTVGAKSAVKIPMNGDLKFVEHEGKAIAAGRDSLDALKDEMKESGAKLLVPTAAAKTATEAGEDAARENSQLAGMVTGLEEHIKAVLKRCAMFRSSDKGGGLKLKPNLKATFVPGEAMKFLLDMRNSGALSDETLFQEAQRHDWLNEDLDWKEEQKRIASQEPDDPLPVNGDLTKPGALPGAVPTGTGKVPVPAA